MVSSFWMPPRCLEL